jgi:hypothetical protein
MSQIRPLTLFPYQRKGDGMSQIHPLTLSPYQRKGMGCHKFILLHFPDTSEKGVPHISLVFREMWDTTALNRQLSAIKRNPAGNSLYT